jgi:hypothetical protein
MGTFGMFKSQFLIQTTIGTIPKSESAIVTIEKHNNDVQFIHLQFTIEDQLTTVDTIPKSESEIVTIDKHNIDLQFIHLQFTIEDQLTTVVTIENTILIFNLFIIYHLNCNRLVSY